MQRRGRARGVTEFCEDDDSSFYEEYIPQYGAPAKRSASRLRIEVEEDRQRSPLRQRPYHHSSYQGEPENIIIENNLSVPQARQRAASTGASPAPNLLQPIYVQPPPRERSHERVKHYHHHRHEYSDSSSDDGSYRSSSRHRKHRRRDSSRHDDYMSPDTVRKLAELEILKAQRAGATAEELTRLRIAAENKREDPYSPDLARKLARLELLEEQRKAEQQRHEQQKHHEMSSATAEKLSRYHELEERRAKEAEEAAIVARLEEQARREKQRKEALLLEYEESQRKQLAEEKEALAKAEANRRHRDAEAQAERDRVLAAERERVAKEKADREHFLALERERQREQAAKEKIERERYLAAEKEKADQEKAERAKIIAEERARADNEKREREEERKRILFEEEQRKKKEKEEEEELRKRILAEEEEKEKKRKAKEKEEEDEFQMKVKQRFMKAGKFTISRVPFQTYANPKSGYSSDYIEDILEEKKTALVRRSSRRTENQLAIDAARPTYIRVQIRHLYPETLNEYGLPWDYDASDDKYILIKEYISHELQQELFEHTRKIKLRREKLLITDGYVKETQTTIKPRDVFKDGKSDQMFIARRKSVSKSPRRSWMFT